VLWSSSPVMASRRSTGTPAARLAASWRMRRSPPYLHRWIPAAKLNKGERLKTANGTTAVADGGHIPAQRDGWMWDLTVPGNGDHDFYVLNRAENSDSSISSAQAAAISAAAVLVHNCDTANPQDLTPTHEIRGDSSAKRVASMRNQMRDGTFDWGTSPIAIAKQDDDMYVVDGHHRLAAALLAGLDSVSVVDVTDQVANGGYLGYTDMQDVLDSASTFVRNRLNPYKLR
jgi:ParB-like nuclease domain